MLSNPRRNRRGVTLVELLLVIAILAILIGVAVPLVQLAPSNRQVREAARSVNTYFLGAQARAAELQRPVGVWLQRRTSGPPGSAESYDLFMAEAPPPYAGDTEYARCWVLPDINGNPNLRTVVFDNNSQLLFSPPGALAAGQSYFMSAGDKIRFNYRGIYYEIVNPIDRSNASMGKLTIRVPSSLYGASGPSIAFPQNTLPLPPQVGGSPPPPQPHPGYPYQVLRREIRSSVGSLQLPDTSTIDLSVSGIGIDPTATGPSADAPLAINCFAAPISGNPAQPIVIMFSPTGGIDTIRAHGVRFSPTSTVHLLIGSTDKVNPSNPLASDANLRELSNLWISINHRTGKIATAENASTQGAGAPPQAISNARSIIQFQE